MASTDLICRVDPTDVPHPPFSLGLGFGCVLPLLAGVLGSVCVGVRAAPVPRLSWVGVRCSCVCLGSDFGGAPPLVAGLMGFVCVCVRAPLVHRHSWLRRVAWGCVLGLGSRLRPATPGWGVVVCVCRCAPPACTPPFRAGVCGMWVACCLAPVPVTWFAAGCVHCLGLRHPVADFAWHLSVCLGCGLRGAYLACLVAPRGVPHLVRSGRSWCYGRLS